MCVFIYIYSQAETNVKCGQGTGNNATQAPYVLRVRIIKQDDDNASNALDNATSFLRRR